MREWELQTLGWERECRLLKVYHKKRHKKGAGLTKAHIADDSGRIRKEDTFLERERRGGRGMA